MTSSAATKRTLDGEDWAWPGPVDGDGLGSQALCYSKPHESDPTRIVEADDKPVPVPADIEDHPVVADDAGISVHSLDVRWRGPLNFRRDRKLSVTDVLIA